MEKILKFFNREYSNINQAAVLLGLFAFLSQILGLFRDRFIANFIGPSAELDAYYAAFRIPDFVFISIASLASVTVLIPFVLNKMENNQVSKKANDFMSGVFSIFFILLVFVSFCLFFLMPHLVSKITPGFGLEEQNNVVMLSRIMLLSPILLGLSNLFGSITQIFQKFFIYALSPLFYNLGIIFGIVFLYPVFGISGLAYGVVLGAFMHFFLQYLTSLRTGFKIYFSFKIDLKEIKEVIKTSLPRTVGLAMNNLALLSIISFASYLQSGSISIFNLSLNLQSVPLGIIGLSYAVASFPALSKSYGLGQIEEFKNQLRNSARAIIFWSLPIAFLFIVLRAQIVRVILGASNFSWEDTRLVAASLAIFSVSVVAQSLIALFARAYYATGNTRKPLIVNFFSSLLIILFTYLFLFLFKNSEALREILEYLFKVRDISGTEVLMLPLAYSLGTILNAFLLWFFLKKDFMRKEVFISKTFYQSLVASFGLGVVSYFSLNYFAYIFDINTFWGILGQGFFSGILGIFIAFVILLLFKNKELKDFIEVLKTRFWKSRILKNTEGDIV